MKPFHNTQSILSDKLLETKNDFTSETTLCQIKQFTQLRF
jgi:hypothetical protein